jgi:hypothetical protein
MDDRTRALSKRLKEYEIELQEEQKLKQQVLQQRKKLDNDLQGAFQQIEEANRLKEDALRTSRRLQVNFKFNIYLKLFDCFLFRHKFGI